MQLYVLSTIYPILDCIVDLQLTFDEYSASEIKLGIENEVAIESEGKNDMTVMMRVIDSCITILRKSPTSSPEKWGKTQY